MLKTGYSAAIGIARRTGSLMFQHFHLRKLALVVAALYGLPAQQRPRVVSEPGHYTFNIVAKDGQVIDGRKIIGFNTAPAAPDLPIDFAALGPVLNNAGFVAFTAATDHGPTLFLASPTSNSFDTKAIEYPGKSVSGHNVMNVGQPAINNANPPAVAYKVTHKSDECPQCRRNGIAIDGDLKLPGFTKISGCGRGPITEVQSPAINDAGTYAAFVTTSDGVNCLIKGGVTVAVSQGSGSPGSQIGETRIGLISLPAQTSLTETGDVAFIASQPVSISPPAQYLCTLRACQSLPLGWGMGAHDPILNNKGQMIYSISGPQPRRATDGAIFSFVDGSHYAMNDRGQVFNGWQVLDYNSASPRANQLSPAEVERTRIDDGYRAGAIPGLPGSILRQIVGPGSVSINNNGEVAFVVTYYESRNGLSVTHQAIVVGLPSHSGAVPGR